MSDKPGASETIQKIGLTLLFIHVVTAISFVLLYKYPSNLDEHAHYSYVLQTKRDILVLPGLTESKLLDENGEISPQDNYLNHPPFYYLIMSFFTGSGDQHDVARNLRFANVLLSTMAVSLLLYSAARLFANDPLSYAVFTSVIVFCPMVGTLAGLINNDNMGLFGAAVAFLGLARFPDRSLLVACCLGVGFVLAAFSKLNAGLAVGILILITFLRSPFRPRRSEILTVGACGIVGIAPYLLTLIYTGSPLAKLNSQYVRPDDTAPISLLQFVSVAMRRFADSWPVFPPPDAIERLGFFVVLMLFILVAARWRNTQLAPTYGLAVLIMLPIHASYVYGSMNYSGIATAMSFRYYLPLWPGVAYAVAISVRHAPARFRPFMAGALIALLLHGSTSASLARALIFEQ